MLFSGNWRGEYSLKGRGFKQTSAVLQGDERVGGVLSVGEMNYCSFYILQKYIENTEIFILMVF